jgi:hypothetical protein
MWTPLEGVYPLNKARMRFVTLFVEECLSLHIKMVCSSRAIMLNQIQWFILVTFKDHIPKDVLHELGDTHHTLDLYCGRYISSTSDDVHILLSKSQWTYLIDLAGSCINRQILKLFHLHDELLEWPNNLNLFVRLLKQKLSILKLCIMKSCLKGITNYRIQKMYSTSFSYLCIIHIFICKQLILFL